MRKTKVFFAIHDHKTSKNQIICRSADIKEDGTAIIQLTQTGKDRVLERKAGDWIEAESFNVFWRKPLEDKARVIAEELLQGKERDEKI